MNSYEKNLIKKMKDKIEVKICVIFLVKAVFIMMQNIIIQRIQFSIPLKKKASVKRKDNR